MIRLNHCWTHWCTLKCFRKELALQGRSDSSLILDRKSETVDRNRALLWNQAAKMHVHATQIKNSKWSTSGRNERSDSPFRCRGLKALRASGPTLCHARLQNIFSRLPAAASPLCFCACPTVSSSFLKMYELERRSVDAQDTSSSEKIRSPARPLQTVELNNSMWSQNSLQREACSVLSGYWSLCNIWILAALVTIVFNMVFNLSY